MICTGGGGKGQQLAQHVPERSWRRTRKRIREGDIGDEEARGKKRRKRKKEADARGNRGFNTLGTHVATWHRMLREGIT
eukprot:scaffold18074_cov140-Isochrysis_galbana.AAC.1